MIQTWWSALYNSPYSKYIVWGYKLESLLFNEMIHHGAL